jgi:hypothetical protein
MDLHPKRPVKDATASDPSILNQYRGGEPFPSKKRFFNYELFNRSNFNIRFWSRNYRDCWHRTCPPIDPRCVFYAHLIPITEPQKSPVSLYFVTTSSFREWVIFAPAAILGCGSRFSGSLSGTEPWFPVTRYSHGSHLHYHRQHDRADAFRTVAGLKALAISSLVRFTTTIGGHRISSRAGVPIHVLNAPSGNRNSKGGFARISTGVGSVIPSITSRPFQLLLLY